MNNWTIWCTQNVLLSVFLLNQDTSLSNTGSISASLSKDTDTFKSAVLHKACHSIDYFLAEYGEDGCFLRKTLSITACRMLLPSGKSMPMRQPELHTPLRRKFRLLSACCLFENPAGIPLRHPDIYYPSVGIFIARDDTLCLAVKAGDNGDSHNHNDTGSFTVYRQGLPLLIDVGVESYMKKTFSPQRYEIWTMQSAYHNLPTIHDYMQKDGESYGARDVIYQLSDTFCQTEMELSAAYPADGFPASKLFRLPMRG